MRKRKFERLVAIPDTHAPYHDKDAFKVAIDFIKYFKPHTLFHLGDLVDFYSVSSFDKDPMRKENLQDEIDEGRWILEEMRKAAPKAKFFYIYGNHCMRLKKYLWTKAPALASLRDVKLENLLNLKDLNIIPVESGMMKFHGLVVKHGNIVRKNSGYSAHGELDDNWESGISGHTHRVAEISKTKDNKEFGWVESGCLCLRDPDFMEGKNADWQLALSYGYYTKDRNKRYDVHPLRIINNKLIFEGKEFSA